MTNFIPYDSDVMLAVKRGGGFNPFDKKIPKSCGWNYHKIML